MASGTDDIQRSRARSAAMTGMGGGVAIGAGAALLALVVTLVSYRGVTGRPSRAES